jgi:hypothetical protein
MPRTAIRILGMIATLPLIGVAKATGNPTVVINSEQRAAAAVSVAFRLGDAVPIYLAGLTNSPKDYLDRTLRVLDASTTAAALKRARNGLVVSCPYAGTVNARLSNGHVLELDWRDCAFDIYGQRHILNGPGRIILCADDLSPDYVYGLGIGDASRNMVIHFETDATPQDPDNRQERNVRLAGFIKLGRPTTNHLFDGDFAHTIDGFLHTFSKQQVAWPDPVYRFSDHRLTATNVHVSGRFEHGDDGWQEDVRLNTGKFVSSIHYGPTPTEPERNLLNTVQGYGLRILNSGDYMVDTETFVINGAANYVWHEASMSCANGTYSFTTQVPLVHPGEFQAGFDSWNQGEFTVNGAATARFSANPDPAEQGYMHIGVDVNNVGSFAYDGNTLDETGLFAAAQCSQ